jgi:hypothetical protein
LIFLRRDGRAIELEALATYSQDPGTVTVALATCSHRVWLPPRRYRYWELMLDRNNFLASYKFFSFKVHQIAT